MVVGNGGYDLGVCGWQICDCLMVCQQFIEVDLLVIQFDDCVLFMVCWWMLMCQVVEGSNDFVLKCLEVVSCYWDGYVGVDLVSYWLVCGFCGKVVDVLIMGLFVLVMVIFGDCYFLLWLVQFEGVVWLLVIEWLVYLLLLVYISWGVLLEDVVCYLDVDFVVQGLDFVQCIWGECNMVVICYLISCVLFVFVCCGLCMFVDVLFGDCDMFCVQGLVFGVL